MRDSAAFFCSTFIQHETQRTAEDRGHGGGLDSRTASSDLFPRTLPSVVLRFLGVAVNLKNHRGHGKHGAEYECFSVFLRASAPPRASFGSRRLLNS